MLRFLPPFTICRAQPPPGSNKSPFAPFPPFTVLRANLQPMALAHHLEAGLHQPYPVLIRRHEVYSSVYAMIVSGKPLEPNATATGEDSSP